MDTMTTTVHVIGKCPVKGCKNRRRHTRPGTIKSNRLHTWTEWTIPAAEPYGEVLPNLSKASAAHWGYGNNPRPSAFLANKRHAYDRAWFAAVEAAGWICTEHDRFMVTVEVAGVFNAEKPCTPGCKSATGPNCECVCGWRGARRELGLKAPIQPTFPTSQPDRSTPMYDDLVRALRDLHHSLSEYPAEWPDDMLAEVGNLASAIKGMADTERLVRATGAYEGSTP